MLDRIHMTHRGGSINRVGSLNRTDSVSRIDSIDGIGERAERTDRLDRVDMKYMIDARLGYARVLPPRSSLVAFAIESRRGSYDRWDR